MRTLGIEEELLLVDPDSGEPVARSEPVIRRAPRRLDPDGPVSSGDDADEPGGNIGPELQQQQLEVDTPPRTRLEELHDDLVAWRRAAAAAAAEEGARIVASGTSPVMAVPRTTPDQRYERMMEKFGITAQDQLACGCHVHVSVADDEEGVAVLDRIRPWLPALLAVTANSPFWNGRDSGYASFRYQSWLRWPSSGATDAFGSAERYHRIVQQMIDSGVVDDGMVYFDARLSSAYPTVEIRTMDICLDPADAVLVAALCRALVETASREWRNDVPAPTTPTPVLRLAMWQASKSGLDGVLLDPATSRPGPAASVLDALVDHVRPALEESADLHLVQGRLETLRERGTGARLQRAMLDRTGSLQGVVQQLAKATAGG